MTLARRSFLKKSATCACHLALAASAIAGYFPARKAAAVQPVEIIRGAS